MQPVSERSARPRWLVLAALLLLSVNLRPTASAPGPVLNAIRADLGLSGATAGLLTSLPVLCFALVGASAPTLANRFGAHRVVVGALGLLLGGQLTRMVATTPAVFLTASTLALAGMALANVCSPHWSSAIFPTASVW